MEPFGGTTRGPTSRPGRSYRVPETRRGSRVRYDQCDYDSRVKGNQESSVVTKTPGVPRWAVTGWRDTVGGRRTSPVVYRLVRFNGE